MDFIKDKNKEKVINSLNELIDFHGEPKELAKLIDSIIFNWIEAFMERGECGCKDHANHISNMRAIRDFFSEINNL